MTSVLVVEDDEGIGAALTTGLQRQGYATTWVRTGAAAQRNPAVDVVLLDLGLPDHDGVDLCRTLRATLDPAIIVVTARGEETDRVAALDAGADDYVVKPFGFDELSARIRAVLRRTQPRDEAITYGSLVIDLRTHAVAVDGEPVALTPREFDVLRCLADDPGRVVLRQDMFARVWGGHWYGPTKVLDVHVASLRRKLGKPGIVETVYGRGFRLADV